MDGVWRQVFGDGRSWVRAFALASVVGVALGLIGPFGSFYNDSLILLLAYWVAAQWLGTAILGVVLRLAFVNARGWDWRKRMGLAALVAVLAALPLAIACRLLALTLWPGPIARIGWPLWYGQTLLMALCSAYGYGAVAGHLRRSPAGQEGSPESQTAGTPASSFLARLPAALGRDLLALSMEDHYVRAHTPLGSALVLIPLHQAVAELDDVPGMRVHRSWWVARAAVAGLVRDGRNLRLRLVTGLEAPVARTSVAAVRAAGWLDDQRAGIANGRHAE
ncbi:MAG: LytTR family DNA-binding domain-containing protein [Azospirillaceae bacterium]|nr:LytTR family DNA-binding domain-containing protein [Azospirillaceae bacterium]